MRSPAARVDRPLPGEAPASGTGRVVLHMVASGGMYGVERMLAGLLPALRAVGCDAVLAAMGRPGTPGGELGEAVAALGVPVRDATLEGRWSVRGLARIEAVLRTCRPEIVHLHGYKAGILCGPLSLLKGIPTVATMHTEVMKTTGFGPHIRLEQQILRRLRGVVAVSEPIRGELERRGVRPGRIEVIPNGIAAAGPGSPPTGSEVDGPARYHPTLVYSGRLVEGKNVHLLIDAVHALRPQFPEIRLLIAGDGPLRSRLEAQAGALGLDRAVTFLGFVPDVQALLAGAACFVLPSRAEGMPVSLLEAMAGGVPSVVTTVGSIPSMVHAGRDAVLVAPDDLPALVAGIGSLLADPDRAARMGRCARERFLREYTADRTAVRYRDFYEAVLAGRIQ
jgi:glycosyltransferase involved in cell wall biosynthesis